MSNLRKPILIFSLSLSIVAVILIGWANWPAAKLIDSHQLHLIAPSSWREPDSTQVGNIAFTSEFVYTDDLRAGRDTQFRLVLEGLPSNISAAGVTWQLHVRSELILPGVINQQEGMITQSVQDAIPVHFDWQVKGVESRKSSGVMLLYADYLSPSNQVESQLLSVNDLELTVTSLAGLNSRTVTSLAVVLLLLSGLSGTLISKRPRR